MKTSLVNLALGINEIIGATVGGFLDFIDERKVVRRTIIVVVAWLMVDAYHWAKAYADSEAAGGQLAIVIAAVLVPVTGLQAFAFKLYDNSRQRDMNAG